MEHLLDGGVHEFGDIVSDLVVHAGRERLLLDLLEFPFDFLDDRGGIGARTLLENDGGRRMTVDVGVNVEELRAEFDAAALLFGYGLVPMPTFSG